MVILQILQGNVDTLTVHKNMFDWRINARYIRINPRAWTPTGQICMRVEIYLCHNYQGEWLHKKTKHYPYFCNWTNVNNMAKNIGRGAAVLCRKYCFPGSPEKTADISRRHHWFPRQMTSEKQAQKFHTDDVTLLSSIKCFWLVEENFPHCMTHDQSEALPKSRQSRVISMEFPRSFLSDVNSRGNQCWRRGMSAVSSDYCYPNKLSPKRYKERTNKCEDWGRISAFWGLKSTTWKENFLLIYCHKSITETLNAS